MWSGKFKWLSSFSRDLVVYMLPTVGLFMPADSICCLRRASATHCETMRSEHTAKHSTAIPGSPSAIVCFFPCLSASLFVGGGLYFTGTLHMLRKSLSSSVCFCCCFLVVWLLLFFSFFFFSFFFFRLTFLYSNEVECFLNYMTQ